jgi:hypothetical protein
MSCFSSSIGNAGGAREIRLVARGGVPSRVVVYVRLLGAELLDGPYLWG